MAVQRVAHLGAQGVARPQAAGPDPLGLPGGEQRVPQLAGAVGADQQLVAVLAGVAGPADGDLVGDEGHVGQLGGQPDRLEHLR